MNDMRVLDDAFAELERRADNAAPRPEAVRSRGPRLVPVAAAVVVAAGLVTAVALLAPNSEPGAPVQEGARPTTTTSVPVRHTGSPDNPEDMASRFREVLGDTATFTVTETGGPDSAAIVGVLTVSGVSGGYDIQIFKGDPGIPGVQCDDLGLAACDFKNMPDGSSIAFGTEPLQNNVHAVTNQVHLFREDGTEIIMHVSNERDPKGESDLLAPRPPLNTSEMIAIVTSKKW